MSLRKACEHGHFTKHWLDIPDPTGTGPDIAWPECSFDATTEDLIEELVKRGEWPHGIPATPIHSSKPPWIIEEPS